MIYKEEMSSSFMSYNTASMNDGGRLRSIFKANLYTNNFLLSFGNFIRKHIGSDSVYSASVAVQTDVLPNQQLKITINGNKQIRDTGDNVHVQLAFLPANGLIPSQEYEQAIETMLGNLDYGKLLHEFICNTKYEYLTTLMTPEELRNFQNNPNIGEYLISVFKFSDNSYNTQTGMQEISSVILSF